ncbi:MAG: hypothetical protein QM599_09535 [Pseudoxanthomonas sp.]
MFRTFRFDRFRARAAFAPRKPRNPLLRLGLGLLGVALLCALLFVGVFVGVAMVAGGLLYRLLRQRGTPLAGRNAHDGRVVEGEYELVRRPVLPLSR